MPVEHLPLQIPFSTIWAFPDGSGYPLQCFFFVPLKKHFRFYP
jgi:hypothetical protein